MDVTRLENLGWKESISLEEQGLKATYKWFVDKEKAVQA